MSNRGFSKNAICLFYETLQHVELIIYQLLDYYLRYFYDIYYLHNNRLLFYITIGDIVDHT